MPTDFRKSFIGNRIFGDCPRLSRSPWSAAQQLAFPPEFITICIKPVNLSINVQSCSERMIAELGAQTFGINITLALPHTIRNDSFYGKSGSNNFLYGLFYIFRVILANAKLRDAFDRNSSLVFNTYSAFGMRIFFGGGQFRI